MADIMKYLTSNSGEATELNESLLSIIRQQRHLATRIIIATQEPTLSPALLDLCNVTIIHRFSSPAWYQMLERHLAGPQLFKSDNPRKKKNLFEQIVRLRTGEALVFSPTSILNVNSSKQSSKTIRDLKKSNILVNPQSHILSVQFQDCQNCGITQADFALQGLGPSYVCIRVRNRLTTDGGKSIMAL